LGKLSAGIELPAQGAVSANVPDFWYDRRYASGTNSEPAEKFKRHAAWL